MEMNYYLNNIEDKEIVLILNSPYNKQINIVSSDTIKENLLQMASEYRIIKVFNMLGIDKKILSLSIRDVSNLERVLIKQEKKKQIAQLEKMTGEKIKTEKIPDYIDPEELKKMKHIQVMILQNLLK